MRVNLLDAYALPRALSKRHKISVQLGVVDLAVRLKGLRLREELIVHQNVVRRHAHGRVVWDGPLAVLQLGVRGQPRVPRDDTVG